LESLYTPYSFNIDKPYCSINLKQAFLKNGLASLFMKTIWVVDDEADFRSLLKTMLEKEGYSVLEVEDGKKCLELIEGGNYPNLILLDVMMPGINGWEVCRSIKKNHAINSIAICMLTVKNTPFDFHTSLNKANANWHLSKPIEKEKLLHAVEWLLNGSLYKKS
jgi:CheY-like chemotaxis protein